MYSIELGIRRQVVTSIEQESWKALKQDQPISTWGKTFESKRDAKQHRKPKMKGRLMRAYAGIASLRANPRVAQTWERRFNSFANPGTFDMQENPDCALYLPFIDRSDVHPLVLARFCKLRGVKTNGGAFRMHQQQKGNLGLKEVREETRVIFQSWTGAYASIMPGTGYPGFVSRTLVTSASDEPRKFLEP
jgi:hypothetical protein